MLPGQAQMPREEERLPIDDIPAETIKQEAIKMLPTREEAFLSEIHTSDVSDDFKEDLKAYVEGDFGKLAHILYPNIKERLVDPDFRKVVVGELREEDKLEIRKQMLDKLAQMKDRVLAERIRTYVNVEKVQKGLLTETDRTLLQTRSDLKRTNERVGKLEESALKDGLTGLWNRRVFDDSIDAVVDRVARKKAAIEKAIEDSKEFDSPADAALEVEKSRSAFLVMIDIDHFKQVNDTYGHQAGDFVLMELAKLLQSSGRKSEKPFRYGGEEFAIIADGVSYDEMVVMADRIREKVENHEFIYDDQKIDITISLGVAGLEDLGTGADAVLNDIARKSPVERFKRLADAALYHAKASGRNAVTRADDPDFLEHLRRKVSEVEAEQTQE